jgi:hypothetical protein
MLVPRTGHSHNKWRQARLRTAASVTAPKWGQRRELPRGDGFGRRHHEISTETFSPLMDPMTAATGVTMKFIVE